MYTGVSSQPASASAASRRPGVRGQQHVATCGNTYGTYGIMCSMYGIAVIVIYVLVLLLVPLLLLKGKGAGPGPPASCRPFRNGAASLLSGSRVTSILSSISKYLVSINRY